MLIVRKGVRAPVTGPVSSGASPDSSAPASLPTWLPRGDPNLSSVRQRSTSAASVRTYLCLLIFAAGTSICRIMFHGSVGLDPVGWQWRRHMSRALVIAHCPCIVTGGSSSCRGHRQDQGGGRREAKAEQEEMGRLCVKSRPPAPRDRV